MHAYCKNYTPLLSLPPRITTIKSLQYTFSQVDCTHYVYIIWYKINSQCTQKYFLN